MLKLMVVDDEAVIRNGIRHSIGWSELGIEVVAEAANGLDASEKAISVQPDIIITDIKMPILDGLSFIKHIKNRLPYTHFILLSGYSDTKYLKEAINLGVEDYIFKNANSQEIIDVVTKVRDSILKAQESRNRIIQRDSLLDENISIIHATLLHQLVTETDSGVVADLTVRLHELGIELPGPNWCILRLSHPAPKRWELITRISGLLAEFTPFVSYLDSSSVVALLNLPRDANLISHATELRRVCDDLLTPKLPLLLTRPSATQKELVESFQLLEQTADVLFWFDSQPVLVADHTFSVPIQRADLIQCESRFIAAFVSKNLNRIQLELYNYFEFLQQHLVPRKYFLESVTRLLASICAFDHNDGILAFLSEIEYKDYQKIFDYIKEQVLEDEQALTNTHQMVERAEQYIMEHLTDNLTLNYLSKLLYISPGYLSRLFKEKTGMGFKEYFYCCRIEKAKELLMDPTLKNYEIATMTGFRDYKHFSNVFLKTCGCSAREYRNNISRGNVIGCGTATVPPAKG
ncbi:MAG: response regulator [Angelakisella sp.]